MKPTPPRLASMKAPPPALPKLSRGKPLPPPMLPLIEGKPAKTQSVPPNKAAVVTSSAAKAVSIEDELKSKIMQRMSQKAREGTTVAIAKPPEPKQETEFEAKMRMRKLKSEQSQQEKLREAQPQQSGSQAGVQPLWQAQLKSTAPPEAGTGVVSSQLSQGTFLKPSTSTPRPVAQAQIFGSAQKISVQLRPAGAATAKPKVPKKSAVMAGGVRHPTVGEFRAAPAAGGLRDSPNVGGFRPSPGIKPAMPSKPSNITLNTANVDKFNAKLELTKWRKYKSCKLTVC